MSALDMDGVGPPDEGNSGWGWREIHLSATIRNFVLNPHPHHIWKVETDDLSSNSQTRDCNSFIRRLAIYSICPLFPLNPLFPIFPPFRIFLIILIFPLFSLFPRSPLVPYFLYFRYSVDFL